LAIGLAAAFAANKDTDNLIERIRDHLPESNIKKTLFLFDDFVAPHLPHQTIFQLLGTKGDVKQTVPAALYCFLKFKEYNEAVIAAIKAGGDTDTTAAIVGGLFAARDGVESIDHRLYGVEGFDTLIELDKKLLGV
jgi:ADP-ribosylglycohydrolase